MKESMTKERIRKILKRIGMIAGGVIVFLILLAVIVLIFLNPIAKFAIQTVVPDVTGCDVTVEDIDISPFSGSASITGLTVGHPEGYSAGGHTVKLGNASANVDVWSIFSSELVIREVKLKDISFNHEQKDPESVESNLTAILANVEAFSGKKEQAPAGGQKVRLEKAIIENVKVRAYIGNAETPALTVTLDKLDSLPADGHAEITGLTVGNPPGFEANDFAVKLEKVTAGVELETLEAEKLVIRQVRLQDVLVNYEAGVTSLSDNLNTLIGFVDIITGAEKEQQDPEKQKMQLNELDIENVRLRAFVNGNQLLAVTVSLPVLGPIGEDAEGMTAGEILHEVCKSVYNKIVGELTSVGGVLLNDTGKGIRKLGDGAKDLKEGAEDLGGKIKEIFKF